MRRRERWAGQHLMDDGRVLRLEYTCVIYEGDGRNYPDEIDVYDEEVTIDCVKINSKDITDAIEKDIEKARAVAFNIPYDFGPTDSSECD